MFDVNFGLFILGIAVSAIGILGFGVFFSNRKSITNITFVAFSIITIVWAIANYLSYQGGSSSQLELFWLRLVIFLSVWHAFSFFQLFYVFPKEKSTYPRWYLFGVLPVVMISSLVNLTPLSFSTISEFSSAGAVSIVNKGPGLLLFVIVVIFCIFGGLVFLIKRLRHSEGLERTQLWFVFWGALITISLIFIFNFFLPAIFNIVQFIPFTGVFVFPFVVLTSFAIFRHHLLSVKVVSTEIIAFLLSVATLFEVFGVTNSIELLFRVAVFLLVLAFSILLIQSVLREVEQREELQRLNDKIEANNKELAELGHFKSELLSLASHQIKSPLAAIKGFVTLIMDGSYGPVDDKIKVTLHKVEDSADELIALINTLLDVRKVEEGKMEYQFEKVNLGELVAHVIDSVMPLAQAKSLALTSELQPAPVFVNIDKEKFRQVIQNLIDNAIKYTPTGFVKVTLKTEGSMATVQVSDSGLGIPASLIPFLFEEFIRDERVKKEIRGTGLGLYIARKITEAHGGKLSAESPGEGKGSTFTITIPTIPA